jgi:hypothetical protein
VIWADVCLSVFYVWEARVCYGVAIAETILVGELVDDFVKIPALTYDVRGLPAHAVELARLGWISVCGIRLGEEQRSEDAQL